MIQAIKDKFTLDPSYSYLNCATMSPQLKSVEAIGVAHLVRKSSPHQFTSNDFFTERALLKERFAELIGTTTSHVSIIPSVSYGLANVVRNIDFKNGDGIILAEGQFPSNYYAWKAAADTHGLNILQVASPDLGPERATLWNQRILDAITERTKVVSLPHVHWADGTMFDLKAIRQKTREHNALLIIDGTQSIGAYPFSIEEYQPDALICGGYKWLMGGYGLGMAYFSEYFFEGTPIEYNWMNRHNSEDFANLVNYNDQYKQGAARYDMGESSSFILVPMLSEGIRQLLEWTPAYIQSYCKQLTQPYVSKLTDAGYYIPAVPDRGEHLFGIYGSKNLEEVKAKLIDKKVHVSFRGDAVRVSPHLYNDENDMEKLISCFI